MGYSPWGRKESDTTEQLTLSLFTFPQLQWPGPRTGVSRGGEDAPDCHLAIKIIRHPGFLLLPR